MYVLGIMAMVPAKPHQPLHNFSLPFLKWGQRTHLNTSHRCRCRLRRRCRCRRLLSHTTTHRALSDSSDFDQNNPPLSSNLMNKHRQRNVDDERENNTGKLSVADMVAPAAADGEVKPWNLRPRRSAVSTVLNHTVPAASNTKSGRLLRGVGAATAAEESEEEEKKTKKKRKLWISLSKEEIEEDLYALSGSKPARRPKKRNKTVQKLVDNLYPALYLIGISADSYRV